MPNLEDRIKEIKARLELITKGEWKDEEGWNNTGMPTRYFYIPGHNGGATVELLENDSNFIVNASKDIEFLLNSLNELTEVSRYYLFMSRRLDYHASYYGDEELQPLLDAYFDKQRELKKLLDSLTGGWLTGLVPKGENNE